MRILNLFNNKWRPWGLRKLIYPESFKFDFSTNLFVLIYSFGGARMKLHYLCVYGIQEVHSGKYDMTGLRTNFMTNLAKSKFVSLVNDQSAISESQLKAILPDRIFEIDYRKELYGFPVL
ncbi:hypothetical protein AVEN_187477-1 [Araneus ventricosus]|uniref:Uncharacterized protein n=1 Tax=Araneus ventricosus TaxID=182803 RepID=A0A4Y2BV29_ARAVE|nr:hypothetical protein AVEN_187477-1 [Araneus ventricosus]